MRPDLPVNSPKRVSLISGLESTPSLRLGFFVARPPNESLHTLRTHHSVSDLGSPSFSYTCKKIQSNLFVFRHLQGTKNQVPYFRKLARKETKRAGHLNQGQLPAGFSFRALKMNPVPPPAGSIKSRADLLLFHTLAQFKETNALFSHTYRKSRKQMPCFQTLARKQKQREGGTSPDPEAFRHGNFTLSELRRRHPASTIIFYSSTIT